ncbi:MAG: glycolate oxidase binding subunit [Baekduia sp.]|nr:glycolate oxidase binding subunit [Baekduia sp.]
MSAGLDAIATLQETMLASPGAILPTASGTKPALSTPPPGVTALDVSGIRGIVEYDPAELTFTALAGTPLSEVVEALAEHGQYLPFDPPWVDAGATLGGTVAAGLSGPGSHRHGGVRDFILGVRLLDGDGRLVGGGGKVVKNAAGFDVSKLVVGSLGRLGVLVRMSFKVFPAPEAWATQRVTTNGLADALELTARLGGSTFELEALDLVPPGELWLRLGGPASTLAPRLDRLAAFVDRPAERIDGDEEARCWRAARELDWVPADAALAKVAAMPRRLADLDRALHAAGAERRYSRAGNLAWVAWPAQRPLSELHAALDGLGLAGTLLRGGTGAAPLLGAKRGGAFAHRVRTALDPHDRFPVI